MDLSTSISRADARIRALSETLSASPRDASAISESEKLVATVVDICSTPRAQVQVPAGFLKSVARLVTLVPDLNQIAAGFGQLVIAAWTSPSWFPMFLTATRNGDSYTLPQWWPASSQSWPPTEVSSAPFWVAVTRFHTASNVNLQLVTEWAELAVEVMNAVSAAAKQATRSQNVDHFKNLLEIFVENESRRELAQIIVYQMPGSMKIIQEAARDTSRVSVARSASLVVDMMMHRATWLAICSQLLHLPQASAMCEMYAADQTEALKLAVRSPFRVIVDILNQGRPFQLAGDSLLVLCASIAAATVEFQSRNASCKKQLYAEFNSHCHTGNLVAILCDFGYLLSYNLLAWCGQDMLIISPLAHIFPDSTLPPVQKPDYFSVKAEYGCKDETVLMIQRIDAYGDLELSIMLVLNCILKVIEEEIAAQTSTVTSTEISKKLTTFAVEHVFALLVAATCCSLRYSRKADHALTIATMCSGIAEKLIALAEKEPGIWITLFNFANDACYADLRLVRVFEDIFDGVLSQNAVTNNADLVKCGMLLFVATFSVGVQDRPGILKYCDSTPAETNTVEVPQSEYRFIYTNSNFKRSNSENDTNRQAQIPTMPVAMRLRSYSKVGK